VLCDPAFAYLAGPDLDSFSGDNTADAHIEVNIDVTGMFNAADIFLAYGVWYSFGEEGKLATVVHDGVTPAGVAVPRLEKTGPGEFLFGKRGSNTQREGGIEAVFEEKTIGFSLVLADIDYAGFRDKDATSGGGKLRLIEGEKPEVQINRGNEQSDAVVCDNPEKLAYILRVSHGPDQKAFVT
jgi:hypothetical protein